GAYRASYDISIPIHRHSVIEGRFRLWHTRNRVGDWTLPLKLDNPLSTAVGPRQVSNAEEPAVSRWIIDIPGWIDHHPAVLVFCFDNCVNKVTIQARRNHNQTRVDTDTCQHSHNKSRFI